MLVALATPVGDDQLEPVPSGEGFREMAVAVVGIILRRIERVFAEMRPKIGIPTPDHPIERSPGMSLHACAYRLRHIIHRHDRMLMKFSPFMDPMGLIVERQHLPLVAMHKPKIELLVV